MKTMKLLILLTSFLCLNSYAQNTKTISKKGTYGVATGNRETAKQPIPKSKPINSESRSYQNDCYKNLAFTVKNYGYNKDAKFYSWGVVVKNNYQKAIQFRYKLIVGNDNNQVGTLTYYVKPGGTYSNDFGLAKAIIVANNSDEYKIEVSEVCFEGQDCNKNGYVDCGGKQENKQDSKINLQTSNTKDGKPKDGIIESMSEDGKMKRIEEYKNGKIFKITKFEDNKLFEEFLYNTEGKLIENNVYNQDGIKTTL